MAFIWLSRLDFLGYWFISPQNMSILLKFPNFFGVFDIPEISISGPSDQIFLEYIADAGGPASVFSVSPVGR